MISLGNNSILTIVMDNSVMDNRPVILVSVITVHFITVFMEKRNNFLNFYRRKAMRILLGVDHHRTSHNKRL